MNGADNQPRSDPTRNPTTLRTRSRPVHQPAIPQLDTGDWVLVAEPVGGFFHARVRAGSRGMIVANDHGTLTVQFLQGPRKRLKADQLILLTL